MESMTQEEVLYHHNHQQQQHQHHQDQHHQHHRHHHLADRLPLEHVHVTRRFRDQHEQQSDYEGHGGVWHEFIVPILPLPVAVVCCIVNFALPGFGTLIAGLSNPCCGHKEEMSKRRHCASTCLVVVIGILQLLLTACFLIGWIWSAIWGLSLLGTSMDYYEKEENSSWRGHVTDEEASGCLGCSFKSGTRHPRSNLIYPIRAPSDIDRDSPPPPYVMFSSPPPSYTPADRELTTQQQQQQQSQNQPQQHQPQRHTTDHSVVENSHVHEAEVAAGPSSQDQNSSDVTSGTFSRCNICQHNFNSQTKKYLCRRCTETVCSTCYSKSVTFKGGSCFVVCDICYDEIMEEERELRELADEAL